MIRIICSLALTILLGFVVNVLRSQPAFADRDVVYGARYYLKPGSKGLSHYHIYRINTTGTGRKQITSGSADDHNPHWSADGKHVIFSREQRIGANPRTCQVAADGGKVVEVKGSDAEEVSTSPDGKYSVRLECVDNGPEYAIVLASPSHGTTSIGKGITVFCSHDSQYLAVNRSFDKDPYIYNLTTGEKATASANADLGGWIDNRSCSAYTADWDDSSKQWIAVIDPQGKVVRKTRLMLPKDIERGRWASEIYPIPGRKDAVIYGGNISNSTSGSGSDFYEASLETGKMTHIATGHELAWLPDGVHFVTDNPRDLAHFDMKRQVWVSPLSIVNYKTGEKRNIVGGLVEVAGFDLRKTSKQ